MKRPKKMKVVYENGGNWITVKANTWLSNSLPSNCIDRFGDVWLRPVGGDLYSTVDGSRVLCSISQEECLVVVERPALQPWEM